MQAREWMLTVAVIVVPLIIAVVVTLWSLDQVRYRPKRRAVARVPRETADNGSREHAEAAGPRELQEARAVAGRESGLAGGDGRGVGIGH